MRRAERPRKHLSAPRKGKRISRPLAERVSDAVSRRRAGYAALSCSEWRPGRRRPLERRAPAGPPLGAICPIKLHELALARSELLGVPKKYRNEAPPSEDTFWGKARRRGGSCIRPVPRGSLSEFDRSVCLTQYHAAVRAARLSPVRSGGWAGAYRWSAARRLTKYAAARPLFALSGGAHGGKWHNPTRRASSATALVRACRRFPPEMVGPRRGERFRGEPYRRGEVIFSLSHGVACQSSIGACV